MSLPLPPPVFPKSLNYGLQRLANLSRRKVRLTSVSGTTATPGGLITVELPSEAIDLDTFAMFAKLTTTTTAGHALPFAEQIREAFCREHNIPKYYESFIERSDAISIQQNTVH